MPGPPELIIDGAVTARILSGTDGPVANYVIARATLVQTAAKASLTPGHGLITGKMRDGIVKRNEVVDGAFSVRITATTPYSIFVHEGTRPHDISAKNAKNLLAWQVNGAGEWHYFNTKNRPLHHPGNRANHFLTDFLHLATD